MPFDIASATRLPIIRETARGSMIVAEVGETFACPCCDEDYEVFAEDAGLDTITCAECGTEHLADISGEESREIEDHPNYWAPTTAYRFLR